MIHRVRVHQNERHPYVQNRLYKHEHWYSKSPQFLSAKCGIIEHEVNVFFWFVRTMYYYTTFKC